MKTLDFSRLLVKKALRLISHGFESDDSLRSLSFLTNLACRDKDPLIAYVYAKDVSFLLPKDDVNVQNSFDLASLQEVVLSGDDSSLKYLFARDVYGANAKEILKHLPKDSFERRELEKDLTPLGEL